MFKPSLRILALANHALVWASSIIVTGIISYFIHNYDSGNSTHIIYEEVIVRYSLHLLVNVRN